MSRGLGCVESEILAVLETLYGLPPQTARDIADFAASCNRTLVTPSVLAATRRATPTLPNPHVIQTNGRRHSFRDRFAAQIPCTNLTEQVSRVHSQEL